jgi:signal transduction histidine kinase
MLDLKTVLIMTLAASSLQALSWFAVWRVWRHLYELKFIAIGFLAIAAGVFMFSLRGEQPAAWGVVLSNVTIKVGLVLMAEGMARFLGQPSHRGIGVTLLLGYAALLSATAVFDPGNLALRVHASTVFTLVMMSLMCLSLLRDRTQPRLLRGILIALFVEYMAASVLSSFLEYRLPPDFQTGPVLSNRNAWYLAQAALFVTGFFSCMLFMVGFRLTAELRDKNASLLREIEARRKLEGRLQASLETERELRAEQVDFMRVVSHEFRTPLAVIRNAVDLIAIDGGAASGAAGNKLPAMREALNRLFALIDRFMASDRDPAFAPELIRIGALLTDLRLHFEMSGLGERLHVRAQDDTLCFLADPDMLGTAVINLVDNALKYSPSPAPVHLDVKAEHGAIVIAVRDRGMGIPAAERNQVGRRFFRASNVKAVTGVGLGLYSVRRLLAYHDGALELTANDDGGTTAIARVPRWGKTATLPSGAMTS